MVSTPCAHSVAIVASAPVRCGMEVAPAADLTGDTSLCTYLRYQIEGSAMPGAHETKMALVEREHHRDTQPLGHGDDGRIYQAQCRIAVLLHELDASFQV